MGRRLQGTEGAPLREGGRRVVLPEHAGLTWIAGKGDVCVEICRRQPMGSSDMVDGLRVGRGSGRSWDMEP